LLLIDLIKEQDVDLMARAAEGSLQKLLKNIKGQILIASRPESHRNS
jgi:hypothetical protein